MAKIIDMNPQGNNNESGLVLPRHVLQNEEAQQEMILAAANNAAQEAYQKTVGAVGKMVEDTARRLELATAFLNSSIMAAGMPDDREGATADVQAAFVLADVYIEHGRELVQKMRVDAAAALKASESPVTDEADQPDEEQLGRFDADQEQQRRAEEAARAAAEEDGDDY